MNVAEYFDVPPKTGLLGIEVEAMSSETWPRINSAHWDCVMDGSLGDNGREFVLKNPLNEKQADGALAELDGYLSDVVLEPSIRAGVHVHVNVQDLDVVQLFTFITAYLYLERVLVGLCGSNREGNMFCLRVEDAEHLLFKIMDAASSKELIRCFNDDNIRYSAMNLKALISYGSVEFRSMGFTNNIPEIGVWCKLLLKLKEGSVKYGNPKNLADNVRRLGMESVVNNIFGGMSGLIKTSPHFNGLCKEADSSLALDLVGCSDWDLDMRGQGRHIFYRAKRAQGDGNYHEKFYL